MVRQRTNLDEAGLANVTRWDGFWIFSNDVVASKRWFSRVLKATPVKKREP